MRPNNDHRFHSFIYIIHAKGFCDTRTPIALCHTIVLNSIRYNILSFAESTATVRRRLRLSSGAKVRLTLAKVIRTDVHHVISGSSRF
jgi:hypothetical protein